MKDEFWKQGGIEPIHKGGYIQDNIRSEVICIGCGTTATNWKR